MQPMKQLLVWGSVLVLLSAAGAHAQELLKTDDGISLRGAVRLLQANAATCNVIAAHEHGIYEARRVNQDQPLHLWELEFSVFNGSGRALEQLIAYYDIASPWPPCTNWTEQYRGLGYYEWANPSGRILHTGAATLPNQTHTETIRVLAFNGVRPEFTGWTLNYSFVVGGTAADATGPDSPNKAASVSVRDSPPIEEGQDVFFGDDTSDWVSDGECGDAAVGDGSVWDAFIAEACWQELQSHDACYVWNPWWFGDETATWTGQCSGGWVEGTGTLTVTALEDSWTMEGSWLAGKPHGMMNMRVESKVGEVPFVNGEQHGTEIYRHADGTVHEIPWVNDERHGMEVARYPDGTVRQHPLGERQEARARG